MPRVRPLDKDAEHKAQIRAWISGGMAYKGISRNDLARLTRIPYSTLTERIKNPETMRKGEEWAIARVIGERT